MILYLGVHSFNGSRGLLASDMARYVCAMRALWLPENFLIERKVNISSYTEYNVHLLFLLTLFIKGPSYMVKVSKFCEYMSSISPLGWLLRCRSYKTGNGNNRDAQLLLRAMQLASMMERDDCSRRKASLACSTLRASYTPLGIVNLHRDPVGTGWRNRFTAELPPRAGGNGGHQDAWVVSRRVIKAERSRTWLGQQERIAGEKNVIMQGDSRHREAFQKETADDGGGSL